jgi:hypothetical protein
VVEAIGPGGDRRFLKVVRPAATDALVHRHELLAGAAPAPPVLAATADGVVVLPALAGTPMRGLLAGTEGGPGDLPTPAALDAVLDALPSALVEAPARSRRAAGDALGRAADHAAVLGTVAPALRGRLDDLTARLRAADPGEHPEVPVHGDFYEAQLLVDGGAVVGLLDVDTAGRGHRIDDWANLLGHLVVLEQVLPDPAITARYRTELVAAALRRWPAAQLRLRVAAVLLGLATGPFRVQQPDWPARTDARLELAEHWADPAHGPLRDVGG